MPTPLYDTTKVAPAYALRYAWSAWCSHGTVFPPQTADIISTLVPLWKKDGLRPLTYRIADDLLQLVFSTTPGITPTFLAARAKGRIDHAFRQHGIATTFTRKLGVRTIGNPTRNKVEHYIARQITKENYCDPRWASALQALVYEDDAVALAAPRESARGRYWTCLHLVLVTAQRFPFEQLSTLSVIRDGCLKIAAKKDFRISRLAVLPDHVHVALDTPPEFSPAEVAGAFQNNLAYLLGNRRVWRDTFYVGTFGEYDMATVRLRRNPTQSRDANEVQQPKPSRPFI